MNAVQVYAKKISKQIHSQKKLDHFRDQSPKEQLRILKAAGCVTPLQARAVTLHMERGDIEGSPGDRFMQAIELLAAGKLGVGVKDKKAKKNLVTLSDIRARKDSLGEKQQLIELRRAGSLSPAQTKAAAVQLAKGKTLEQALMAIDEGHLLGEVAVPAKEEPDADDEGSNGGQEGGEGAGGEDPPSTGGDEGEGSTGPGDDAQTEAGDSAAGAENTQPAAPQANLTIDGVLDLNIPELAAKVAKIKAKPALLQLLVGEEAGKQRKGALEAIVDQLDRVGVTDAEIASARKIAAQGSTPLDKDQVAAVAEDFAEEE